MTREEEIKEAARQKADQYWHPSQWSDTYYGFIAGARWADKNCITKILMNMPGEFDFFQFLSDILKGTKNNFEAPTKAVFRDALENQGFKFDNREYSDHRITKMEKGEKGWKN